MINFQLVGDKLELMMAPGDVLCVKGSGRLDQIGAAGGFLGHVLVAITPPRCIKRQSAEAEQVRAAFPDDNSIAEMWCVATLDCSRQVPGLNESEALLYVERGTGRLIIAGELTSESTLVLNEHEAVELWQSPRKLRESLRVDLMQEVVADMREFKGLDWSALAVARAVMKSARHVAKPTHEETMEKVQESWKKAPICTSVVIIFWQRYLVKLAAVVLPKKGHDQQPEPAELVMRWMPLKADRVLPGDLLNTLKSVGWVCLTQIPRIFQPMVCHAQPQASKPINLSTLLAKSEESRENVRFEDSNVLDSRSVTLTC
jgi:hypothetical protein